MRSSPASRAFVTGSPRQDTHLTLRRLLGRPIQLPLEYSHLVMRVLSLLGNHAVRPPGESVAKAGALCSGRVTTLRRSYGPLRLPTQAPLGTSASGLISSVPTARAGGPGGASRLTPLFCPCMLPPSPREPRRVRTPDSSPADTSLRLTTGGSATPLPAPAAIAAGYTLTGLIGRSRLLRPAGLSPSLGCVRPHLAVEPSRTLCRSCFDGAGCPATPGPRLLGRIGAFPRRAPFIPLEQRLRPRSVVRISWSHGYPWCASTGLPGPGASAAARGSPLRWGPEDTRRDRAAARGQSPERHAVVSRLARQRAGRSERRPAGPGASRGWSRASWPRSRPPCGAGPAPPASRRTSGRCRASPWSSSA